MTGVSRQRKKRWLGGVNRYTLFASISLQLLVFGIGGIVFALDPVRRNTATDRQQRPVRPFPRTRWSLKKSLILWTGYFYAVTELSVHIHLTPKLRPVLITSPTIQYDGRTWYLRKRRIPYCRGPPPPVQSQTTTYDWTEDINDSQFTGMVSRSL